MRGARTNGVPRLRLAILAVALLGACSVKTEGAACLANENCPAGQACGYDRKCSEAAAACPQQPVCQGHACSGSVLQTCTPDAGGICAASGQETCTENQDCNASAGLCSCKASRCPAGASAVCAANGDLVTCATEAGTSCPYEVSASACSAVRECRPGASTATCECKTSRCTTAASVCDGNTQVNCLVTDGCAHETDAVTCSAQQTCATGGGAGACVCQDNTCQTSGGTARSCSGGLLVTCQQEAGTGCWHAATPVACADAGQTCTGSACACPAAPGSAEGEGCSVAGATQCAGAVLLACRPSVGTSSCLVWTRVEDCSAAGLTCGGAPAACACPANDSAPLVANADPASIAARAARLAAGLNAMSPTGVASPVVCRHGTLADALAAAWAAGAGSTARAIGWSASQVVFTEAALTVRAGVTLTTGDEPLTTTHYVVEPGGEVGASTFITLEPGSSIAGFEIRNANATGAALATACPGAADTGAVAVGTVKVTGAGSGATPPRFLAGLRHDGHCPTTLSASTLDGCGTNVHAAGAAGVPVALTVAGCTLTGATDSAVFAEALGATSTLALTGNIITGNDATTPYTLGVNEHRGGGIVLTAPLPAAAFTGNRIYGNGWDQILVATSSAAGTLDLKGGTTSAACGATANVICRNGVQPPQNVLPFVGVFSNGAPVQADWNQWTQQPAVLGTDVGGTGITGYNSSCPATGVAFVCP